MTEKNNTADDKILRRLRQEFIETARDQLEDIDGMLEWVAGNPDDAEESLLGIRRYIHNIKGQGATFGFPVTGRVAHMLEDYLKNVDEVGQEHISDIDAYLALMKDLIASNETIAGDDYRQLFAALPVGRSRQFSRQELHPISVLLVMPPGIQRKLVAAELLACGFQVMRAYDTVQALAIAQDTKPEIVFVNQEMTPFDGRELCRMFSVVESLEDIHVVLFTSYEKGNEHLKGLPPGVSVVKKTRIFTEKLGELMIRWKVFE